MTTPQTVISPTSQRPFDMYLWNDSYYCGKLEAYFRYKELPYNRLQTSWETSYKVIYPNTGLMNMPVVHTPDGLWLKDTTPMIDWLEERYPPGEVIPTDPFQAFFCRLLEDYADEWLWRPAMFYRWYYQQDAYLIRSQIYDELLPSQHLFGVPMPKALLTRLLEYRQKHVYLKNNGVTHETIPHIKEIYLQTLQRLEKIFQSQPYLLGRRPCLADFGFFASMFRHFSNDPTPAAIMRRKAPAVFEWVARLWNAKHSHLKGGWHRPGAIPEDWGALLEDIGVAYLPYLHANALNFQQKHSSFDVAIQGVPYREIPVLPYRAWCRERLQVHFRNLPEEVQPKVEAVLKHHGCWESLWRDGLIETHLYDNQSPTICAPRQGSWLERQATKLIGTPWGR